MVTRAPPGDELSPKCCSLASFVQAPARPFGPRPGPSARWSAAWCRERAGGLHLGSGVGVSPPGRLRCANLLRRQRWPRGAVARSRYHE
eukprot:6965913-Lingulodinium_polyedra.AAC.1